MEDRASDLGFVERRGRICSLSYWDPQSSSQARLVNLWYLNVGYDPESSFPLCRYCHLIFHSTRNFMNAAIMLKVVMSLNSLIISIFMPRSTCVVYTVVSFARQNSWVWCAHFHCKIKLHIFSQLFPTTCFISVTFSCPSSGLISLLSQKALFPYSKSILSDLYC